MPDEFDEQGNPIETSPNDAPDPVVAVTAERDEMAGRARAAEDRAKAAEERAQRAEDFLRGNKPSPPAQPTGLTEEQFYELQSDPAKFQAYIDQQSDKRVQAAIQSTVAQLVPQLDSLHESTLSSEIPDWKDIREDVLVNMKEVGYDSITALKANPTAFKIVTKAARADYLSRKPVVTSEEEEEDDNRSAMLAHGTSSGGGTVGKKSEWGNYQPTDLEKRICAEEGLKPKDFIAKYIDKEVGDYVEMSRKKAANA